MFLHCILAKCYHGHMPWRTSYHICYITPRNLDFQYSCLLFWSVISRLSSLPSLPCPVNLWSSQLVAYCFFTGYFFSCVAVFLFLWLTGTNHSIAYTTTTTPFSFSILLTRKTQPHIKQNSFIYFTSSMSHWTWLEKSIQSCWLLLHQEKF